MCICFQLKLLITSFFTIRSVLVWVLTYMVPFHVEECVLHIRMCSELRQAVFLPLRELAKNKSSTKLASTLFFSPLPGWVCTDTSPGNLYIHVYEQKGNMKFSKHNSTNLSIGSCLLTSEVTFTGFYYLNIIILNEWFPRSDFLWRPHPDHLGHMSE